MRVFIYVPNFFHLLLLRSLVAVHLGLETTFEGQDGPFSKGALSTIDPELKTICPNQISFPDDLPKVIHRCFRNRESDRIDLLLREGHGVGA